jgi:carbamoyltransferase
MNKTGYIAGIARGHNAGVCLLKDGEIVFSIEEERLTRQKYDGGPYASMVKLLDFTDKIDYLVISHTHDEDNKVDFTGEKTYQSLARKLGLIESEDQVVEMWDQHHKSHAACAFYRSGFETANVIIVDGAGTFIPRQDEQIMWEVESMFEASYPAEFKEIYKHFGGNGPWATERFESQGCEVLVNDKPGIVKAYEAVTQFCGWQPIEAGKTMGLFPYGEADKAPKIFNEFGVNRDVILPTYPNGSLVQEANFPELQDRKYDPVKITAGLDKDSPQELLKEAQELLEKSNEEDVTLLESRRNMAYQIQTESQEEVLKLIYKAIEKNGNKNIVISGGYGLNCVANYWYLDKLPEGTKLFVEPISNDAGTAIGAALLQYHRTTNDSKVREKNETLYLGPVQEITEEKVCETAHKYGGVVYTDVDYSQVIDTIRDKNIVSLFQERCENGPRALGNRSLMYDATDPDGKDFVNLIKKREYFRPFAASVLQEDVHDWFDLRGMEDSPSMMYAVNCQPGVEEKIPAVIHVDGTCRIQTVTKEQNEHWYNLISEFKKQTGVPALFNTSFNLGGEPLVETIDDAMRTLYNSGINHIYFPVVKMMVEITHNDRA